VEKHSGEVQQHTTKQEHFCETMGHRSHQLLLLLAMPLLLVHGISLGEDPLSPLEPCQQIAEEEKSADTAASLLSVEGMRLKLACESERDDRTAASIRVTQAHDQLVVQDSDLQYSSTQAVRTAERLSTMARTNQVDQANSGIRLGALEAQEAEQRKLAVAQKAFADAASQNSARESQEAALATSTKQGAVELAIASWRSQRELARKQTHQVFISSEQQMAEDLATAAGQKTRAIEAADAAHNKAVPSLQKRLTDFEHGTKQLSSTLKASGKSQAEVVAEYDSRYREQEDVAAEVHAEIKKIETDTIAAKQQASTRYATELTRIEKAMRDEMADAVARKDQVYSSSKKLLQQQVDKASNAAATSLEQQHAETQQSAEVAQTSRDRARAEAVAAANDATEAAKEAGKRRIASTNRARQEASTSQALELATSFREKALGVQTLNPSL